MEGEEGRSRKDSEGWRRRGSESGREEWVGVDAAMKAEGKKGPAERVAKDTAQKGEGGGREDTAGSTINTLQGPGSAVIMIFMTLGTTINKTINAAACVKLSPQHSWLHLWEFRPKHYRENPAGKFPDDSSTQIPKVVTIYFLGHFVAQF